MGSKRFMAWWSLGFWVALIVPVLVKLVPVPLMPLYIVGLYCIYFLGCWFDSRARMRRISNMLDRMEQLCRAMERQRVEDLGLTYKEEWHENKS